ncbi:hypothetical protein K0504_03940 [Neiella marina]|uniref:Uncharacterized protein n=1 Tax=Neiella holothuriorum TaxID=2870530 RepID=A0ABS7EE20_9GAMM|nr:hypothetical protein [Neiella holothuriorum]MBW8190178.1 hypothetical protein [Neiella holothuriorum]
MIVVIAFGLLMAGFCLWMVYNPHSFADGIIRFSQQRHFHLFEIISRITIGALFVALAHQTAIPTIITVLGYLLICVGVGLLLTPPRFHQQFAVWAATKFANVFRIIGVLGVVLALAFIWSAVAPFG